LLAQADQRLFHADTPIASRQEIMSRFLEYARKELGKGTALNQLTRHILGLYQGQPGARGWRRQLSTQSCRPGAGIEVIMEAMRMMAPGEWVSDYC
jgi:tRNA-dihydrouridine synthase A